MVQTIEKYGTLKRALKERDEIIGRLQERIAVLEGRKADPPVTIPLTLGRDDWCELINAVGSKAYHLRRGDYGKNSGVDGEWDDGVDIEQWASQLEQIYEMIAAQLDREGIPY